MREVTTAVKFLFSTLSFNRVDPNINTVFPRIIAGGDYFFFRIKRGDYSREVVISNIAHWKSCLKYFVLLKTESLDNAIQ